MPDDTPLTNSIPPAIRKRLGRATGGYLMHAKYPNAARENGAKGGQAYVAAHPEVHSSEHGRRLALAKRGRWYAAAAKKAMEKDGGPSGE